MPGVDAKMNDRPGLPGKVPLCSAKPMKSQMVLGIKLSLTGLKF